MIAYNHRFHGRNSLRRVYARGRAVRSPRLSVKYLAAGRPGTYRAAVVVSRKVHKSSVVRNRIRRRLYELLRLHADQLAMPADIVITVYSEQLADMPADHLRRLLLDILGRAGLIAAAPTATDDRDRPRPDNQQPPHGIVRS